MEREQLKVLHSIISEPNEFKRYCLLQMWISQLFTATIIDPIKLHENRLKDTSNITSTVEIQSLYDVLRDIKTSLTIKNQQLEEVHQKMLKQMNVLKVLNKALELEEDPSVDSFTKSVSKVQQLIQLNSNYIEHIGNLSESKIEQIINDSKNQ